MRSTLAIDLYNDHAGWLVAWLRSRVRCHERAADLAQDLFCKILERPPGEGLQSPRAYLATAAIRLLIDQQRRLALEKAYLSALTALQEREMAASPHQICEAVEALTLIARMLDGLPDRPRRAFLLSRLDGLGHAEIADLLGVSTSMVRKYVATALVHCYAVVHGLPVERA
ncbi:sigma-70 family RNA polymerase sigma factor [Roseomonas sp. GC11]|uniref:sigma-70 family RNA polymerase sigma factor n=1 Tax=Roseomonas sp. GC11 TaxID=2950546 RepID=UPI00210D57D0|nr:sigma-70 family RNA polymerase sigma factor [Roseomonas sp. GC11]MCQ4160514.1 sigma-70 family RNA polymerase sigma factor [Roseomonas sp. GC11]